MAGLLAGLGSSAGEAGAAGAGTGAASSAAGGSVTGALGGGTAGSAIGAQGSGLGGLMSFGQGLQQGFLQTPYNTLPGVGGGLGYGLGQYANTQLANRLGPLGGLLPQQQRQVTGQMPQNPNMGLFGGKQQ